MNATECGAIRYPLAIGATRDNQRIVRGCNTVLTVLPGKPGLLNTIGQQVGRDLPRQARRLKLLRMTETSVIARTRESRQKNVEGRFPNSAPTPNLRRAAALLWPHQHTLGAAQTIWQLVGRRSTVETIRQYLYERDKTPRWMRKIIHDELEARGTAMLALAAEIASEQDGPGRNAAVIRYWRKKRAAEAAHKSYSQEN